MPRSLFVNFTLFLRSRPVELIHSYHSLSYVLRASKYILTRYSPRNNRGVHYYLALRQRKLIYLGVPALHLLPPGHRVLPVGVHQVPDEPVEPRLEDHARQRQQRQLAVVPARHTAHVNVGVAWQFTKLELLATRRGYRADAVHRQRGVLVAPGDLHLVPVAVAEVVANGDDLRTAAEVVSQSERALDQLHLEEVVRAAVVGVEQQTVALLGLELELQRAVQASVPFSELRVTSRRTFQHERHGHLAEQHHQERQQRAHVAGHERGMHGCCRRWS